MTLTQVRTLALSLPEAMEAPHFHYTSFRVRGKIVATAPPDGTALHVFLADEDRERALALEPDWIEPLYWGKRVCGVRVMLARAKPKFVAEMLRQAWRRKAPKSLLAALP